MRKAVIIPAGIVAGLALFGGTAYGAATLASHDRNVVVVTAPSAQHRKAAHKVAHKAALHRHPAPAKTVYVPAPQQAAPPAPVPARQFTNGPAVVLQFYQDLNDHNYQAAWNLGGDNIGGSDYNGWVAGYATTASVTVDAYGTYDDGTVWTHLSAVQTDGSVKTYDGTYTVSSGVIVSANMVQTG
jgi:hypothetical protein